MHDSRLLQWLVFFRHFNAIGPLFCSFVQHHQLELRTSRRSKTYSKRQNLVQNKNIDAQNLENIGPFGDFTRIFSALCDFFGFHQRVSSSFVSIFCNTMDVKKIPKGPPFYIFRQWHCSKIILIFFSEIFIKSLQGPLKWGPSSYFIAPTLAVPGLFDTWSREISILWEKYNLLRQNWLFSNQVL